MKKIINGKVYDTDKAQALAVWENGENCSDLNHVGETLYRKKTGEYFLLGEGGANTRYASKRDINRWSGGWRIMPLSYQEATEWAAEHLEGDKYEEIFGPVVEDDSKKAVTYWLSVGSIEKLRRAAEKKGVTASDLLNRVIASM